MGHFDYGAFAHGSAQLVVRHPCQELVVTGARMLEPLRIVADPKLPRQPLPAHDGADFLKTVPGFNVIRKGGPPR